MAWIITHLSTVAFLLLLVVAGGASMAADHEFKRAHVLQDKLDEAAGTISKMQNDQKTNEGISNEYEKTMGFINGGYASDRLRADLCFLPSDTAAGRVDAGTLPAQPVAKNGGRARRGISTGFLRDYAAEAGKYQAQLKGLQEYVTKVCLQH